MIKSRAVKDLTLSFDLGGTKLRGALVDPSGRIRAFAVSRLRQDEGYEGILSLFKETASKLPDLPFKRVAVASAGPLHAGRGVLLDPTNFFTEGQSWGVLPLVKSLKKVFKKPVLLENDAAAAVIGERWKGGHGSKVKNIVAMTLGTGVGVGVLVNGELVRAGRGLHPEAGHIPIDSNAKDYPCGCGAYGCIEAFLAGSHFAKRLGRLKGRPLSGQEAVALAKDDVWVQEAFREYGRHLALAVRSLSVLFAPEVVVISGGFSHAASLFMSETQTLLPTLMERYRIGIDLLPEIKVSKLQDDAGVLGAAYLALKK